MSGVLLGAFVTPSRCDGACLAMHYRENQCTLPSAARKRIFFFHASNLGTPSLTSTLQHHTLLPHSATSCGSSTNSTQFPLLFVNAYADHAALLEYFRQKLYKSYAFQTVARSDTVIDLLTATFKQGHQRQSILNVPIQDYRTVPAEYRYWNFFPHEQVLNPGACAQWPRFSLHSFMNFLTADSAVSCARFSALSTDEPCTCVRGSSLVRSYGLSAIDHGPSGQHQDLTRVDSLIQ